MYTPGIGNKTKRNDLSEYDQDIPQSHTADNHTTLQGRTKEQQQPQETRKTNKVKQPVLSLPPQDDCKTRKDTKNYTTKIWNKHRIPAMEETISNKSTKTESLP